MHCTANLTEKKMMADEDKQENWLSVVEETLIIIHHPRALIIIQETLTIIHHPLTIVYHVGCSCWIINESVL
jgi:hypothetical protein